MVVNQIGCHTGQRKVCFLFRAFCSVWQRGLCTVFLSETCSQHASPKGMFAQEKTIQESGVTVEDTKMKMKYSRWYKLERFMRIMENHSFMDYIRDLYFERNILYDIKTTMFICTGTTG